jgi:hypothetical protein
MLTVMQATLKLCTNDRNRKQEISQAISLTKQRVSGERRVGLAHGHNKRKIPDYYLITIL